MSPCANPISQIQFPKKIKEEDKQVFLEIRRTKLDCELLNLSGDWGTNVVFLLGLPRDVDLLYSINNVIAFVRQPPYPLLLLSKTDRYLIHCHTYPLYNPQPFEHYLVLFLEVVKISYVEMLKIQSFSSLSINILFSRIYSNIIFQNLGPLQEFQDI